MIFVTEVSSLSSSKMLNGLLAKYPKIETKKNRLKEYVVFSNFRQNDTMCHIS